MDDNKQFWERFSRHYAGFMRRSQATYQLGGNRLFS